VAGRALYIIYNEVISPFCAADALCNALLVCAKRDVILIPGHSPVLIYFRCKILQTVIFSTAYSIVCLTNFCNVMSESSLLCLCLTYYSHNTREDTAASPCNLLLLVIQPLTEVPIENSHCLLYLIQLFKLSSSFQNTGFLG